MPYRSCQRPLRPSLPVMSVTLRRWLITHRYRVLENHTLRALSSLSLGTRLGSADVSACQSVPKLAIAVDLPRLCAAARKMSGLGLPRPGRTSGESAVRILVGGNSEKISGRCEVFILK